MSILKWVLRYYKLFCVVSWCHISWTAIQLYSQAAWMEGCFHFIGNSARWRSDHEDHDAECWIQDGADKKEATVVTTGNTAQCDMVFGAVCPGFSLRDLVFVSSQSVWHLPSIIVTWWLLCVESFSSLFMWLLVPVSVVAGIGELTKWSDVTFPGVGLWWIKDDACEWFPRFAPLRRLYRPSLTQKALPTSPISGATSQARFPGRWKSVCVCPCSTCSFM